MSQPRRAAGAPQHPDDDLVARITGALHRRAADAPDPDEVADRLTRALAAPRSAQVVALRRGGRVAAAGVVTGALAVAVGGAAAAANPYSGVAAAVETAAQSVGLEWSFMPAGYSREQYEALSSSGLTMDDINALGELWQIEGTDLKARIGQTILDGVEIPIEPGSSAPGAQYEAFWAAGYTAEDLDALVELWGTPWDETKLRAGQTILDGQRMPIPPSGTPAAPEPARAPSSGDGPADDSAPPAVVFTPRPGSESDLAPRPGAERQADPTR